VICTAVIGYLNSGLRPNLSRWFLFGLSEMLIQKSEVTRCVSKNAPTLASCSFNKHLHTFNKKLCCRKEAARASCLYIFNTKRRPQSFIISCFGFRYTTAYNKIIFCSLLFGVFVHAAGRHKQIFAGASRPCDLHCMVVGNCFCHFVVRTSSNRSIASGSWPTVSYTQLRRR